MAVYLALKKRAESGIVYKLSSWLIRFRLVSKYHHAGIVCDGVLYDVTARHNMMASKFDADGWDLIKTGVNKNHLISLFNANKDVKYDYFSLLAFLGFKARDSKRLYCFEWCYLVLTAKMPSSKVTVETLLLEIKNEEFS
mgnify:CR=1 FL=1